MVITKEEALNILELIRLADTESCATLKDFEFAKRLIQHFSFSNETDLLERHAEALESAKNYKPTAAVYLPGLMGSETRS